MRTGCSEFFTIQIIQTAYILGESKKLPVRLEFTEKGAQDAKDLKDWQVCWTAGCSKKVWLTALYIEIVQGIEEKGAKALITWAGIH